MPLSADARALVARAFAEHWALGAFNTSNLEITQAIAWGLQDAHAPGIIQTSETAISYAGLKTLRDMVADVAAGVNVPLLLHLDHGTSYDIAAQCIDVGYNSVMIDGSALPFADNVTLTKQVVERAHAANIWVEGEMGAMPGKEGRRGGTSGADESLFTTPDDAQRFVEETGVDALAVSVGTIHGAFRGEEKIHFDLLAAIHAVVAIPLVLHGASGLPAEEISRSLQFGVAKVNIDTELREAFHDAVTKHDESDAKHSVDPRAMLTPARDAMRKLVAEKAKLLGAEGTA